MVEKEIIKDIFDNVLSKDYIWKCHPTVGEMKSTLSGMSFDEQYEQLKEKNLLNPLEEKDFPKLLEDKEFYSNALKEYNDKMSNPNTTDEEKYSLKDYIAHTQKWIEDIENELFQYGRRLIEGYTWDLPPVEFNRESYVSEEYNVDGIPTMIGELENSQILAQQGSVNVDPNDLSMINIGTDEKPMMVPGRLNDKRLVAMNNYFNGDCHGLNYWISNKKYLKALDNKQRTDIKKIDSLMDESPGLQQDTVLYRGGYFNVHTRVGDTVSFKGYQSTSFSRATAESYNEDKSDAMTYVIHAPKGTKGIVGNDSRFENGDWEHEYVLPRNTRMKVVNIDYDNNVCEVVIEGE